MRFSSSDKRRITLADETRSTTSTTEDEGPQEDDEAYGEGHESKQSGGAPQEPQVHHGRRFLQLRTVDLRRCALDAAFGVP